MSMHHGESFSVFDGPTSAWESAGAALARSAAALETVSDDEALRALGVRAHGALREWGQLEAERARLRGLAIAINARIRVADAALDHRIELLAARVIEAHGGAEGERYRALFALEHEAIVALGLDAEIPAVTAVLAVLDGDQALPAELAEHREPLRRALQVGNRALLERGEVYGALGALQARIESWIASAVSLRAHLRDTLGLLAKRRGLPPRWVDALCGE
jgi:hypothetical protein